MASLSGPSDASFELFTQLPTGIRLKIWRLALPSEGRIVRLCRDDSTTSQAHSLNWEFCDDFSIVPACRPPAVLQVNVEAREEGLRFNKLCIPTAKSGGQPKRMYTLAPRWTSCTSRGIPPVSATGRTCTEERVHSLGLTM